MKLRRDELMQSALQNMRVMSRMGAHRAPGAGHKAMPTHAQIGILFMLAHHKAQGIKELAARFGISSSAATQLVNGMVEDDLLVRTEDEHDRRMVRIDLTNKGKKKLEETRAARMQMMKKIFEPLSDQELEQFIALQQKMSDHAQNICPKK